MLKKIYIQHIEKRLTLVFIFSILLFSANFSAQTDSLRKTSFVSQNKIDTVPQSSIDTVSQNTTDTTDNQSVNNVDRNSHISSTKKVMDNDVSYSSTDSTVMLGDGTIVMYNQAIVTYGDIKLEAYYIRMNRDSNMIYAEGRRDSTGKLEQTPVFTDGSQTFNSETVKYNIQTGKGLIYNVASEQADGYVTGGITKRVNDSSFCMKNGRYTTCSHKEHPHFYLQMSKAKVRPGKSIVTGPAWLVIEDVPLPLAIPFGFFPFTESYSSGFIMPSYGEESTRGFYLKEGGYYFALSDYMDLSITGDIYSKGSWATYVKSRYKKRYKFSGNLSTTYRVTISGDKDIDDYTTKKDFSIKWTHSQDSKASAYSSFSAGVNFSSSSYESNDLDRVYSSTGSSNHKSSSISYSRRFPNAPFNISLSANASQNASDSSITVSLPKLTVSMSKIYPLKRKKKSGADRWYEKIGFSYSASTSNTYSGYQYELFESDIFRDWSNGVKHSIPISTSFQILDNITVSPSVSYTERWYSNKVNQSWDFADSCLVKDTVWGFNRVFDYSTSVSLSTKLYGMYIPVVKLFGGKVQAVRHVITPSVSLGWRPDFAQEKFGYYDSYVKQTSDTTFKSVQYSRYSGSLYGTPGSGKSGTIGLSLGNNLEMKVLNDRDTTSDFRKIALINRLNFSTSYNMMADSLNWSYVTASLGFTVFKKSFNVSASFDPYSHDSDGDQINTFYYKDYGKPLRLRRASTSLSMSLNNEKINKLIAKLRGDEAPAEGESGGKDGESLGGGQGNQPPGGSQEKGGSGPGGGEGGGGRFDEYGYQEFIIPWNLSLSYSLSINSSWNDDIQDFEFEGNSNLSVSGSVTLTEKWGLSFSSGYNLKTKAIASTRFSITRDLHCWNMSASFVPIGTYKSYNFCIKVSSAMLQDLKYDKKNSAWDRSIWD